MIEWVVAGVIATYCVTGIVMNGITFFLLYRKHLRRGAEERELKAALESAVVVLRGVQEPPKGRMN